jgi:hypothetical protein
MAKGQLPAPAAAIVDRDPAGATTGHEKKSLDWRGLLARHRGEPLDAFRQIASQCDIYYRIELDSPFERDSAVARLNAWMDEEEGPGDRICFGEYAGTGRFLVGRGRHNVSPVEAREVIHELSKNVIAATGIKRQPGERYEQTWIRSLFERVDPRELRTELVDATGEKRFFYARSVMLPSNLCTESIAALEALIKPFPLSAQTATAELTQPPPAKPVQTATPNGLEPLIAAGEKYVRAKLLWRDRFPTYKRFKSWLAKHPEVPRLLKGRILKLDPAAFVQAFEAERRQSELTEERAAELLDRAKEERDERRKSLKEQSGRRNLNAQLNDRQ